MRFSFPEQRASFDDSGFENLEPRDYWAECYGCFNGGSSTSGGGSSSSQRGTTFGVDGRSVTGSTKADREIGYSDGAGGKGSNFDQMSTASSSDIRAAVDAANRAAADDRNTISAARAALGGDAYNIGSGGEFSVAAMAAPSVAAPMVAGGSGGYDDASIRFAQNQMGAGSRPEARVTRRPKPSDDLMSIFPGVLGQSIFAGSQGRDAPIERSMALTALQDRAASGDLVAQRELDDLQRRGAVDFAEANYAMLQQQKGIDASRILNQAPAPSTPSTPIQVAMGTGRPTTPDTVFDIDTRTSVPGSEGGYEDDPAYDADIFGTPRYAGGQVGLDGNLQGFENARQMADFVDKQVEPSTLQRLATMGPVSQLLQGITGRTVEDYNRDKIREQLEGGATFNPETEQLEGGPAPTPVTTASGVGGGGGYFAPQPMVDPCPEGYRLVNGVCEPIEAVAEPAAAGSSFQMTPTTNLPTTFAPTTQATPVGTVNPFVLQPTRFAEGGSVPRATEIAGQPHMLSYITPGEAEVLKSMGGAGEPGPGGIPAYFYDEVGAVSGTTGNIGSGGQNQDFTQGDDNNDTQVTSVNTQGDDTTGDYNVSTSQANTMQDQLKQQALQSRADQSKLETQQRNQAIQSRIDSLRNTQSQLDNQPGLATSLLEGIGNIFEAKTTTPQAQMTTPQAQTMTTPQGSGFSGANFSNVYDGQTQTTTQGGSLFDNLNPEAFRESLGLGSEPVSLSDIGKGISGFFSGAVGPSDTWKNAGLIGQSDATRNSGSASRF